MSIEKTKQLTNTINWWPVTDEEWEISNGKKTHTKN